MSNYITEAFKKFNLLESEDISLNAAGIEELRSFMDEAGVDPDEEVIEIYDMNAQAEDELKQSYLGKAILECKVCHSYIFEDRKNIGTDVEGNCCTDIECPYCLSTDGFIVIGEVAPYNESESEELIASQKDDEEDLPDVEVEGGADDVDEEDIVEESLDDQEADDDEHKDEAEEKIDEGMKLDGVKELYDNDEIRGVEDLEGDKKLEGDDRIRGDKHKAPINESVSSEEIKRVLDKASKNNTNVLFQASPGSGIVSAIKEWCQLNAYNFKRIDVQAVDSKDLGGIIAREGDTSKRLQSEISSMLNNLDEHSVLVLDSLDRASKDVLGALLSTIQNAPCIVVGISSGRASLDPAMKNRFYTVNVNESCNSKKVNESIEDVSVTTEDEVMTMATKDDGGVVIETTPKDNFMGTPEEADGEMGFSGEEMIVPMSDESAEEVEAAVDANSIEDGEEDDDFASIEDEMSEDEFAIDDFDDFDEESFNGLGESYLKSCYENVTGFKTTGVSTKGNKLFIEGVIKFDSGNIKETNFVFESVGNNKFEGYNKQISRGKKTFKLNSSVDNKKLVCESLNYNYRSKNELNESVRVYGTVKRK